VSCDMRGDNMSAHDFLEEDSEVWCELRRDSIVFLLIFLNIYYYPYHYILIFLYWRRIADLRQCRAIVLSSLRKINYYCAFLEPKFT